MPYHFDCGEVGEPVIRCESVGKWSAVHICDEENYLQCGPYDEDTGAPAYSQHYSCWLCVIIEATKRNEEYDI